MSIIGTRGVDVGDHNGRFNFEAMQKAGYEFAMLKLGYGSDIASQDDGQFERSVNECERLGIPWGAWLYSYALNAEQAKSELNHMLRLLKGKKPTMPIALDVEDSDDYRKNHGGWNYTNVTNCTKIVLEGLAKAGYYPVLYTGFDEIENYISKDIWQKYDMWFAHWAKKCGYTGSNLGIWQYGGEENFIDSPYISGVSGKVDKDFCYKDYPTIIKKGGYNGWPKSSDSSTTTPTTTTQPITSTGNPAIKQVQTWLNTNYKTGLAVDGCYGPKTKSALVKALQTELNRQKKAGLTVDGVYGNKTNAAVFNLSVGAQGNIVKVLQGLLICNGLGTNGFDGVYGNGTKTAVKTYQSNNKLTADGIAGKQTLAKLCK